MSQLKVRWRRLCRSIVGCDLRIREVHGEGYCTVPSQYPLGNRFLVAFISRCLKGFFFVSFAQELDMLRSETFVCPLETVKCIGFSCCGIFAMNSVSSDCLISYTFDILLTVYHYVSQ
jgi:hypothetical protein